LTLGLETLGRVTTSLIPRNTTIPTKKTETFTTAADSQNSVEIHVLQGERPMAPDNKSIGRFILDGILPAPRGVPQVEVAFDIDANGILSVSARDKGTGKEQKIVIQPSSGLSKADINRMVDDAKAHESDDQKRRAEMEARNQADSLVYSAEKMLRDSGDKVPQGLKGEVVGKIADLKNAIGTNNAAQIQTATADLNRVLQQVGQAVYSQTPAGDGARPGDGAGPATGDGAGPSEGQQGAGTVEGEFREV
jgi:molecular chaperone DnaK